MKKEIVRWAALMTGIIMIIQGCTYNNGNSFTQDDIQENTKEYMPDIKPEQEVQVQKEIPEMYYAYHKLDEDRQKIYIEIFDALINMESDSQISTFDGKVIDLIFSCVMNDHPELFYVEGYKYTEYTLEDTVTGITFSGTYSMTKNEAEQTKLLIEQNIEECFNQVPLNEDEYSTVRFLYEWLINHTEYDKTVDNNQNICSVFLKNRSVCQGYAKAMQYMLQKAGIQCFLVTGFTNSERHAWNLVRVNGEYYYLDPTWGDASYDYNGQSEQEDDGFAPSINYDYMLVTTDEITRTHSLEKVVELPICTATTDNYYVREGLYFDSYDEERLAYIFENYDFSASEYVTIKCSDAAMYEMMINELIGAQKIFDFTDRQGDMIAYALDDFQRTISFWNS